MTMLTFKMKQTSDALRLVAQGADKLKNRVYHRNIQGEYPKKIRKLCVQLSKNGCKWALNEESWKIITQAIEDFSGLNATKCTTPSESSLPDFSKLVSLDNREDVRNQLRETTEKIQNIVSEAASCWKDLAAAQGKKQLKQNEMDCVTMLSIMNDVFQDTYKNFSMFFTRFVIMRSQQLNMHDEINQILNHPGHAPHSHADDVGTDVNQAGKIDDSVDTYHLSEPGFAASVGWQGPGQRIKHISAIHVCCKRCGRRILFC